ncbi:uncharacterized protein LOC135140816 [Zophobas morio]|uniref:uncharacterized protein LOC135140816 n=1 Tax=Zophobas morio TaxID=2755281 RepID=UPI003082D010
MKNLSSVTKLAQQAFFSSFDYVFCDVDGVLWHSHELIPGSRDAIAALKSLGKKVFFVSNNSTKNQDVYYAQLKTAGFDLQKSELIRPPIVMIDFLKKRNFTKEIYLIGMASLRGELENAGFKISRFNLDNPEESVPKYLKTCITVDENVGAVIADLDLNMNVAQLQKAATYLNDPEVIFITGGSDRKLFFGPGQLVIGPGKFHEILEEMSGRKPHCLAKPSPELNDYIRGKLGVEDASRVLFIGDSIPEDMGFATNCGYQKLLVLSGLTSRETMEKWEFPEEFKPEYYVESLKVVWESLSGST